MARRPNADSEAKLSNADLAEFRRTVAAMTRNELERHYLATHNACGLGASGRIASPKLMQELVQLWKGLRAAR